MNAPHKSIKLVALDLDGTVVGRDLTVNPRVIETIACAKSQGILTTIVTGRMYKATIPFIRLLGIEVPVVCYQGGGIHDGLTGELLQHQPVPHIIAQRVLQYAQEHALHIQMYAEGTYFIERMSPYAAMYAHVSGVEAERVSSLAARFAQTESTKIVFVIDPPNARELVEKLHLLCGGEAYITRSNPEFVEVMAPGVDKGAALDFVARRLGISRAETLAVGDSWNDIPLLQAAGFGVAMGDAPDELVAVADAVVASVEANGVVEAFERFVLPAAVGADLH